ncbi:MAG: phytanoyl-CoA dioxygenase family protein [Aquabacterium sp.]
MNTAATSALAHGEPRDHYDQNGYVIFPSQISPELIDRFLSLYRRDIFKTKTKFYRQNTNVYDCNRYTSHDHVIQSFLDVHNYKRFPEFRQAALDIFFSPHLLSALTQATGHRQHNLMQSMLFDANAATPPHQDWWYLDTVPNGNLMGIWIALEDIHEDAGRFYVLPGSQNIHLHEANLPHSEWLQRMRSHLDAHPEQLYAPPLKKGDVLIWNSRTIHGSLATKDLRHSRKSLTAHFMPSSMTFGNLFTAKPWIEYERYGEFQYFANQPEHSLKAEMVSKLKVAVYDSPRLMRLVRKFQRRSVAGV